VVWRQRVRRCDGAVYGGEHIALWTGHVGVELG
jgi:hypothetical protein